MAALQLLNGHQADEPTDQSDATERIWTTAPKTLVAQIDDFHFGNRCKNRSAAVLALIKLGLQASRRN